MSKLSMSSRWLVGAAVAIVALVIVSLVLALAGGDDRVELLAADSPEGTVQRYLRALKEEDYETARGYLDDRLKLICSQKHFRDTTRFFREDRARITLDETVRIDAITVEVRVRISSLHTERPFIPSESSYVQSYFLRKEAAGWRFYEPPYPMGWCPSEDPRKPFPPPPVPAAS